MASAKDVPTPRISPLKVQDGDTGDMPAEGEADPESDLDAPVDTSIIPPSGGNGEMADFLATGMKGDFAGGGSVDQPLQLMPIDPADAATGGPIDLGAAAQRADPLFNPTPSEDSGVLGLVTIEAHLTEDSPPIQSGVVWRVFREEAGKDGKLPLVGQASGGSVTLKLRPGEYLVHCAYGRAGFIKKVTVTEAPTAQSIVLNAGGLRLLALVGKDQQLPPADVHFTIYASDEAGPGERVMVADNVPPGHLVSLNAGIYHIVCRYGDANAVVRADIKVEPGKLTEAAVYQKAARLTLKLVEERGGEALANTAWSVVTPAGESVVESVGAFPSVILAVGDYTAIAKNGDRIFERNFTVEAGLNRDVEVLAE
ncbi:MAG: hypothetical protein KDJ88_22175 [Bauldia sp.]|nr:hypothetical protein [Bauldia sp.]